MTTLLFQQRGSLADFLRHRERNATEIIRNLEPALFENTTDEEIVDQLLADNRIPPLRITGDTSYEVVEQGQHDMTIDLQVPFEGQRMLFDLQPSTYDTSPPQGDVRGSELVIRVQHSGSDSDSLNIEIKYQLDNVITYIGRSTADVEKFNANLEPLLRRELVRRKEKLGRDAAILKLIPIPLKLRAEDQRVRRIPVQPRRIAVAQPPVATSTQSAPEYQINDKDFDYILDVISNMAMGMERSPRTFAMLKEEDLRTILLVALNGHFRGGATGETFSGGGNSDIFILHEDKRAFIAECKLWDGPKYTVIKAIDQLFSYATWRDAQTALIIFNRETQFSTVLKGIEENVPKHDCYERSQQHRGESHFRYRFRRPDDSARKITLAVLAFNVPRIES